MINTACLIALANRHSTHEHLIASLARTNQAMVSVDLIAAFTIFNKGDKTTMKTSHVIVKGLVQGVCFRDYTRREADHLGICGWVRNLPDGTVETVIQGEKSKVDAMLAWLKKGSPHAAVETLVVSEPSDPEKFSSFTILF